MLLKSDILKFSTLNVLRCAGRLHATVVLGQRGERGHSGGERARVRVRAQQAHRLHGRRPARCGRLRRRGLGRRATGNGLGRTLDARCLEGQRTIAAAMGDGLMLPTGDMFGVEVKAAGLPVNFTSSSRSWPPAHRCAASADRQQEMFPAAH